jgi:hypothetical protein
MDDQIEALRLRAACTLSTLSEAMEGEALDV